MNSSLFVFVGIVAPVLLNKKKATSASCSVTILERSIIVLIATSTLPQKKGKYLLHNKTPIHVFWLFKVQMNLKDILFGKMYATQEEPL